MKMSQTRWLTRGKLMQALADNWEELKLYFNVIQGDLTTEQRTKARPLREMLLDESNYCYMVFSLSLVLEFERVNRFFQHETADSGKCESELVDLERSLRSRVIECNGNNYPPSRVDYGGSLMVALQEGGLEGKEIKERCSKMLFKALEEVTVGLPDSRKIFSKLVVLKPGYVLSSYLEK